MCWRCWWLIPLFLCSTSMAQDLELDGPDETDPGKLVILDATDIPSVGRSWKALNAPEDSFRIVDDGQRLVFATPKPGRYWFTFSFVADVDDLRADLLDALDALEGVTETEELATAKDAISSAVKALVDAQVTPVIITHELVVSGTPPDDDVPTPTPPRPLPDGKYKLAKLSRDLAMSKLDAAARERAADVAGAHRAIAAQIAAGALKGQERILRTLSERLKETLGDDFDAWKAWGNGTMTQLSKLYDDGDLKTDEDFSTAFSELALGLEVLK